MDPKNQKVENSILNDFSPNMNNLPAMNNQFNRLNDKFDELNIKVKTLQEALFDVEGDKSLPADPILNGVDINTKFANNLYIYHLKLIELEMLIDKIGSILLQ